MALQVQPPQGPEAPMNESHRPQDWNTEANNVLQGADLVPIIQILRLGLYEDVDSLRQILQSRARFLDPLLDSLPTKAEGGQQPTTQLTPDQKIDEILTRAIPTSPSTRDWKWKPIDSVDETDPQEIAACIAEESYSYFRQVPFVHWLKHSLGYQEGSVAILFWQHDLLMSTLYVHLLRHRNERDMYDEVGKELRHRSPLAYQALHWLASCPGKLRPSPAFDLGIITGPLIRKFQQQTLKASLGDLAILATRFDATYISAPERINWSSNFKTEVTRFKWLTAEVTVEQLAIKATSSDKQAFDPLCPAGFRERDSYYMDIYNQWKAINVELGEICIAHPLLMQRLRELAEEMYHLRNWHHLAAILLALQKARFDESTSPNLFNLILPEDHYATFRAHMKAQPGLPFLLPYEQRYSIDSEATLRDVFTFSSYNVEVLAQSGSSTGGTSVLHRFLPCIFR